MHIQKIGIDDFICRAETDIKNKHMVTKWGKKG